MASEPNAKAYDASEAASAALVVSEAAKEAPVSRAEFDELKEHVSVLRKVVHGASVS
jgi:hypothetical protein